MRDNHRRLIPHRFLIAQVLVLASILAACVPIIIADAGDYAYYVENRCDESIRADISSSEGKHNVEDVRKHKQIGVGEVTLIQYVTNDPASVWISISAADALDRSRTVVVERSVEPSAMGVRFNQGDRHSEYTFLISGEDCPAE